MRCGKREPLHFGGSQWLTRCTISASVELLVHVLWQTEITLDLIFSLSVN